MVPPCSDGISRAPPYSGYCSPFEVFTYGTLTLSGVLSHTLRLTSPVLNAVRTPGILLPPVWPNPRSLATTSGISVDVFSSPYLDVSVQAVPYVLLFDSSFESSFLFWWDVTSDFGWSCVGYCSTPLLS